MCAQLVVVVAVLSLDGGILDGAVHPLDLLVGPRVIDLGEAAVTRFAVSSRCMKASELAHTPATLDRAERNRVPMSQFWLHNPGMTISDFYAIRRATIVIGRRKIGLTSRAMRCFWNITEPEYGTSLDDMLLPDGTTE